MSEKFLYPLFGKQNARMILTFWDNIIRAVTSLKKDSVG